MNKNIASLVADRMAYKSFPRPEWLQGNVINYETIVDVPTAEIIELHSQWEEIERHNTKASSLNHRIEDQIRDAFVEMMEEVGCQVKGVRGGILQPFKNTIQAILTANRKGIPAMPRLVFRFQGKDVNMNHGMLPIRIQHFKQQCERKLKSNEAMMSNFLACVNYAKEHNIDITQFKAHEIQKIIDHVESIARNEFAAADCPDGTEFEIDCCNDCSTWVVGEHRCSCGNRRMSLMIEGTLATGFFAVPEAY